MAPLPRKVLFIGEGATLAHVARPYVLAGALPTDRFDVVFARPSAFAWLTAASSIRTRDLACQDASVFAHRLNHGLPLYDYPTLLKYVEDDLALIDAEKPDVIIGDFRLSLSVSARLRSVPYITICDAYWSPESQLRTPLPVLSFTRFVPLPIAEFAFRHVSSVAFALHARPLERLRAHHGLPSLGYDLRRCYTDADFRLFANFPAVFPDVETSPNAAFIGPIAWSPKPTQQLDFLDAGHPYIYVTMGSSGKVSVLSNLIPALEQTGNNIVVSTAGKQLPHNFRSEATSVFDYLPGELVCMHARLVVCNGGSPTTNQALFNGVAVLGIAWNMDQLLNMQAIENFGAGILVRGDRSSAKHLRIAVNELMTNTQYANRARILADLTSREQRGTQVAVAIDRLLSNSRAKAGGS